MAIAQETAQRPRLFSHDEVLKMVKAGILHEDDRVELIKGELIWMSPIGDLHIGCVDWLVNFFIIALTGRAIVRSQSDLRLGDYSGPMPDLVLLRPRGDFYRHGSPGPDDVLLVIEVADSSIAYDTGFKAGLYAEHAVPEYWVVDLNAQAILVHLNPNHGLYGQVSTYRGEEEIAPRAFPDAAVSVHQVLGLQSH
jgi:Uma2 family endonuclease